MKLILTGSSGFIGKEVLQQSLSNPAITSIIALSRRTLPISDPKLKTVILDDFTRYPQHVLDELQGAEACIWALGVKTSDPAIQRSVTLDYTRAATTALPPLRPTTPSTSPKPFRFIFVSGILSVRDQAQHVWFMSEARKIKGEAENQLLALNEERPDVLEAFIVRPGGVLGVGLNPLMGALWKVGPTVEVGALAKVLVELAVRGGPEKVLENAELVRKGRELEEAEK